MNNINKLIKELHHDINDNLFTHINKLYTNTIKFDYKDAMFKLTIMTNTEFKLEIYIDKYDEFIIINNDIHLESLYNKIINIYDNRKNQYIDEYICNILK